MYRINQATGTQGYILCKILWSDCRWVKIKNENLRIVNLHMVSYFREFRQKRRNCAKTHESLKSCFVCFVSQMPFPCHEKQQLNVMFANDIQISYSTRLMFQGPISQCITRSTTRLRYINSIGGAALDPVPSK